MKRAKFITIMLAVVATVSNAATNKKMDSYWFKASDDTSLGDATSHHSSPAVMCAYLEKSVGGLNFCGNGGFVYAKGFASNSPEGDPEQFILATEEN